MVPRGNIGLVSCKPLTTIFHKSIQNLILWVFLFKDTLSSIYCWFINIELTANSTVCYSRLNEAHLTSFLPKAHHGLLALGTPDSTSTLLVGAILNIEVTSRQHKNTKIMTLNRTQKRYLSIAWVPEQEGRALFVWLSLGKCRGSIFHHSAQIHAWPWKCSSIDSRFQVHFIK